MLSPRWVAELVSEGYQVGRPALGLMSAFFYLVDNPNPSLFMTLYFGFIFQLASCAGNDYMDWERDTEHEKHGRVVDSSRGKARSKDAAWWWYISGSFVALLIGIFADPFFGVQYFILLEVCGQWAYNGIFLGFPMNFLNNKSLTKSIGFPFDLIVCAWTFNPFPYLVGQQSWTPGWTMFFWGGTMMWAQVKDYDADKKNGVRTTATLFGEFWTSVFLCICAVGMSYRDARLLPCGLYTIYKCYLVNYSKNTKAIGKHSVVMALNLVAIVWLDKNIPLRIKVIPFLAQLSAYMGHKYPKHQTAKIRIG